jgi:hypothetical protein
MGFFDSMKGAMNFVTGGAAKVSLEWQPQTAMPGEPLYVRVTVSSTGPAINSGGVFVDVVAAEQTKIPQNAAGGSHPAIHHRNQTFSTSFPVAPPFQLGPNESRVFDGQVTLPPNVQPTYDGPWADHVWTMQGRVEMTGNDPDSGYVTFRVGLR